MREFQVKDGSFVFLIATDEAKTVTAIMMGVRREGGIIVDAIVDDAYVAELVEATRATTVCDERDTFCLKTGINRAIHKCKATYKRFLMDKIAKEKRFINGFIAAGKDGRKLTGPEYYRKSKKQRRLDKENRKKLMAQVINSKRVAIDALERGAAMMEKAQGEYSRGLYNGLISTIGILTGQKQDHRLKQASGQTGEIEIAQVIPS